MDYGLAVEVLLGKERGGERGARHLEAGWNLTVGVSAETRLARQRAWVAFRQETVG